MMKIKRSSHAFNNLLLCVVCFSTRAPTKRNARREANNFGSYSWWEFIINPGTASVEWFFSSSSPSGHQQKHSKTTFFFCLLSTWVEAKKNFLDRTSHKCLAWSEHQVSVSLNTYHFKPYHHNHSLFVPCLIKVKLPFPDLPSAHAN